MKRISYHFRFLGGKSPIDSEDADIEMLNGLVLILEVHLFSCLDEKN